MKILVITNKLAPSSDGWGRYSVNVIRELQRNGNRVSVVSNLRGNESIEDVRQFKILPEPLSFKKTFFLSFLYVARFFFQTQKREKYDVIHCFVEPYAFFTFILSKVLGVKYFITIHGSFGLKTLSNPIFKFLQTIAYRNAQKVICVSNYTKQRIMEHIDLDNLLVIPNGLAVENFPKRINSERKKNILLSVGALKRRKGQHLVLEALVDIKKQISDIKYIIVGDQSDTTYFSYLKEIVLENGLEESVCFLSKIPDDKLKNLYLKSKVFILTPISYTYSFEGFGLVYLEANAYGIPVIGSYGNGGEEAIKDGFSGILTKPEDIQDISSAVISLFSDSEKHNTISNNARIWAENMLWDKQILEYIKVYKQK